MVIRRIVMFALFGSRTSMFVLFGSRRIIMFVVEKGLWCLVYLGTGGGDVPTYIKIKPILIFT